MPMNVNPSQNPAPHSSGPGTPSHLPLPPHPQVVPLIPWQSRHAGTIDFPSNFPEAVTSPKYAFGTQCRWTLPPHRDWGIVIGQVYAPDQREDPTQWSWVYLILLHPHSPSGGWIAADWVDEQDLELLCLPEGLP